MDREQHRTHICSIRLTHWIDWNFHAGTLARESTEQRASREGARASCPISIGSGVDYLPAMPFHAAVIDGKCKCFAPQVCDE